MKLSAEKILEKFLNNSPHSFEVKRLALMLFDEMSAKVKEMTPREREILAAAALLHDIGYYVEAKSHNKHSQDMVLEYGLEGFKESEKKLVANICRYHRGSLPDKEKHDLYASFDKSDRKIVRRLGGILRVADGLDKAHTPLIEKININFDAENSIIEIIITPISNDKKPDLSHAIRKRDLLEIGFKAQSILKFSVSTIY